MAGHNKWVQIKHKKAVSDAKRSKIFSKMARVIALESKKAAGDVTAPSLRAVIEKARSYNMPGDIIERNIKKGTGEGEVALEAITYEAYAPGGVAIIIEALTSNRNKASSEIKYILTEHGSSLGAIGSASWAFKKGETGWIAQIPVDVDEATRAKIDDLIDALLNNDEVQMVYTTLKISL